MQKLIHVLQVFRRHLLQFCELQVQYKMQYLFICDSPHAIAWDQEVEQAFVTRGNDGSPNSR
jgi:hypothetical protein